jgi:hypothetical protein
MTTTQLKTLADTAEGSSLYATLERVTAEARQLMDGPFNQIQYGLAFRGDYVDRLFRKAVRFLDGLVAVLHAVRGRASEAAWEAIVAAPLGEEGRTLEGLGLARGAKGRWETDYLRLEYALFQDPEQVLGMFDALLRELRRPRPAALADAQLAIAA